MDGDRNGSGAFREEGLAAEGDVRNNVVVIGGPGSDVSAAVWRMMAGILPTIGSGTGRRALLYDISGRLAALPGLAPGIPAALLNPLDARGAAWDIARDITTPADAERSAATLLPDGAGPGNPFFGSAARALLGGVFLALSRTSGPHWHLAEVLRVVRSRDTLTGLLRGFPDTRCLEEDLLRDDGRSDTPEQIMSVLALRMRPFESVAAAWQQAEGKVSARRWRDGESILVLSTEQPSPSAVDAVYRAIFDLAAELALTPSEPETGRTWFFLDGILEMPPPHGRAAMESLTTLLERGRSRGVTVILGVRDMERLRDEYGEESINMIMSLCDIVDVRRRPQ